MMLKDLFPRWRAASGNGQLPWEHEVDLSDSGRSAGLLGLIAMDQSAASLHRPAEFWSICRAIVEDILALRAAPPIRTDPLDLLYLQFEASLVPLQVALNVGDLGAAHDWIVTGLGNDFAHAVARAIDPTRLYAFARSRTEWIAGNRLLTVPAWAASFFYVARRSATFRLEAEIALPPVIAILDTLPADDPGSVEARCMIVAWAAVYARDQARGLARPLEAAFENRSLALPLRTRIAITFASNGPNLSARPPAAWAAWAVREGAAALKSHEPFQLIWHQVETAVDWDRVRAEALAAAASYATSLRPLRSPVAIAQATDQRSALLGPALIKMTAFERSDELLAILQRWYDVPPAHALRGGTLFVSVTHPVGTAWLGAKAQLLPAPDPHPLAQLTRLANAALGLAISIQGEAAPIAAPERAGEPDYALGPEFHAALTAAYRINEVERETFVARASVAMFPGQPHPLQALLHEARGETLPMTASLEEPAQDRRVRRVLIWSADNDLFAGFEPDAVEQIFTAAGIECDRRSGNGAVAADFIAAYGDPTFDLVWVAGHGAIDHWRHGSARIMIGADCFVGIDDLIAATPAADARRLLMLNICDGGVAAVNGGIQRLGLAPMLSGRTQATISHLWPVRPLVAAAFGALLAGGIARRLEFFAAYEAALGLLRRPSADVAEAVREIAPEADLVERLAATDLQTENLFHWGSPAFLQ
jgi:hypothetical protein